MNSSTENKVRRVTNNSQILNSRFYVYKKLYLARCWWLTPIIVVTLEAEIRRILF
jgi:hypothetical protein